MGEAEEVRLVDGVQHLHGRALDDLVLQGGDAEAADRRILLEAENTVITDRDATGHAERNLMSMASRRFEATLLGRCTIYTSTEPCVMCAGSVYWVGVRRVVYGLAERQLLALTGSHEGNPTLDLPCRTVFAAGQSQTDVIGPMLTDEAMAVHAGFWG